MPRIFISYRRDDAAGDAGRLADHLHRRFGAAQVFLDIDTIEPGVDFVAALQQALERTAVMLVVIGPRWLAAAAPDGTRRLDDRDDFVRLEVETALQRNILVVPVLVQGARLPARDELPDALAPLVSRQSVTLTHADFHGGVERLCARLAPRMDVDARSDSGGTVRAPAHTAEESPDVQALLAQAAAQCRRDQPREALATLARARSLAPASARVGQLEEEIALDWIRNARVEHDSSSFTDVVAPALSVLDTALASATGTRRADLLAHAGWAAFLAWRDGRRQLDPAEWYREALAIDAGNPYANAMLAHWMLFRGGDMTAAAAHFAAALRTGRDRAAVRRLQWAAYRNTSGTEAAIERVRLADAMRRDGDTLTPEWSSALWSAYYFALPRHDQRCRLLEALPADDHIATLEWAFASYAAGDDSRRQTLRCYVALLHAGAGRADRAVRELTALEAELSDAPGSLRQAVRESLQELSSGAGGP